MSGGMMDKFKKFFTLDEDDGYGEDSTDSLISSAQTTAVHHNVSKKANLVPLPVNKPAPKQELLIFEPTTLSQAKNIASALRDNKCVIINTQKADREQARRTVDFLQGISFAINGHYHRVADHIFVFVPSNMIISGANCEGAEGASSDILPQCAMPASSMSSGMLNTGSSAQGSVSSRLVNDPSQRSGYPGGYRR